MKIHLDTDFGGDPDDACALAMLLGWEDVDILGITTNLDADGRRAGCVHHYLELAGRTDIPVEAGARESMTTGKRFESTARDPRHWPEPIESMPSSPGAAEDLLEKSTKEGATMVAIGALTNLAVLESNRPGTLKDVPVVVMGGWVKPPGEGLPQWGPDMDFNIQCDTEAAQIVAAAADLTLVTLPVTLKAHLTESHLPRLRASGPVGGLLARQSEVHARDQGMTKLGQSYPGLPDDLVNFHWDPLTSAVATGWNGVQIEEKPLRTDIGEDGVLRWEQAEGARMTRVVTDIDVDDFAETWLASVERAQKA